MRHPLTGGSFVALARFYYILTIVALLGGMTVAFADVVVLRDLLAPLVNDPSFSEEGVHHERPFADWARVSPLLKDLHWQRKGLSSTVNILSVALYDLFGADGA